MSNINEIEKFNELFNLLENEDDKYINMARDIYKAY